MAKILYPVGSEVQIRDWRLRELRDEGHTYDRRKRVVKAYHRGEDRPYELEGMKQRFAVEEIKSFRQLAKDDEKPVSSAGRPVTSNGVTMQEVEELVAKAVVCVEQRFNQKISNLHNHLVEDARIVAHDAVRSNIDADA